MATAKISGYLRVLPQVSRARMRVMGFGVGKSMSTSELRKRRRQHLLECGRIIDENNRRRDAYHEAILKVRDSGGTLRVPPEPTLTDLPEFPEECRGMTCGARTRAGTACKRRDLCLSGRCKLHGGMSTGPRTKRGKRKASQNGLKPKRRKRSS